MGLNPIGATMTAKQLVEYVTQHMTAEEALLKMFASTIDTYEHMKGVEGQTSPIFIIAAAALEMGWGISVEKDEELMRGLSIGSPEYFDTIFGKTESDQ